MNNIKISKTTTNIIIKKDIAKGQRVRAYTIHACSKRQWTVIAQGQSIGNKRIHRLEPIEVEQLRLEINEKILPPFIEKFSIY